MPSWLRGRSTPSGRWTCATASLHRCSRSTWRCRTTRVTAGSGRTAYAACPRRPGCWSRWPPPWWRDGPPTPATSCSPTLRRRSSRRFEPPEPGASTPASSPRGRSRPSRRWRHSASGCSACSATMPPETRPTWPPTRSPRSRPTGTPTAAVRPEASTSPGSTPSGCAAPTCGTLSWRPGPSGSAASPRRRAGCPATSRRPSCSRRQRVHTSRWSPG